MVQIIPKIRHLLKQDSKVSRFKIKLDIKVRLFESKTRLLVK